MTDHIPDATKITRDEIVELVTKAARSSESRMLGCGLDDLGRLIELVRADERERLLAGVEMPEPDYPAGSEGMLPQDCFTRQQLRETVAAAVARKPLTDEQAKNLLRIGPVHAPNGVISRDPLSYRKELLAERMHGLRLGEAAHDIKE